MIVSIGWEEDILKMVLMFMHWFIMKIVLELVMQKQESIIVHLLFITHPLMVELRGQGL